MSSDGSEVEENAHGDAVVSVGLSDCSFLQESTSTFHRLLHEST